MTDPAIIAQAIALLRRFNEWRRGDDRPMPFTPGEIGQAIDIICSAAERAKPVTKRQLKAQHTDNKPVKSKRLNPVNH